MLLKWWSLVVSGCEIADKMSMDIKLVSSKHCIQSEHDQPQLPLLKNVKASSAAHVAAD